MATQKYKKLNQLLSSQPPGIVLSSSWLRTQGYSFELQRQYKKSQWFDAMGTGALVRHGDQVDYLGGVYALQTQLGLSVHPGATTALALQGKAHYLQQSLKRVQLFGASNDTVPSWFVKRNWGVEVDCRLTSFLPHDLGLIEVTHKAFQVKVSSPARAVMECLYLVPKSQPLMEVYELMESLNNLRPLMVQHLLEACTSVKVKRLFLYLADKADHEWFHHLNLDDVDLGSGKRAIVPHGDYIPKYQITVPKELTTA